MKSLEDYLKLPYTIETRKESDGSYFIKVKELPGCMSVGEDLTEAYEMIEDAKALWIQSCLDDGRVVPEPEEEEIRSYSGKFVVRITPALHRHLAESAKNQGVSLNHYVTELLSSGNAKASDLKRALENILNNHASPVENIGKGTGPYNLRSEQLNWYFRKVDAG